MELTQERLDDLVQKGLDAENVFGAQWLPFAEWTDAVTGHAKDKRRASTMAIIEEATGEKVTIVEPEPEIPEAAIEAVAELLWLRVYRGPFADAAAGVRRTYLSCARKHLIAAYKAGWGGLRK